MEVAIVHISETNKYLIIYTSYLFVVFYINLYSLDDLYLQRATNYQIRLSPRGYPLK